ncbi:MAG: hypothetical protein IJ534_01700 [Bacteroidaceae bacterium]|nr:hypothetical protein [Bacteroidaceae bacterium]
MERIYWYFAAAVTMMLITSCNNDDSSIDIAIENREILTTRVENSAQSQAILTDYLRLEYAEYFAEAGTRSGYPDDYADETDEMFKDYDLSTQLVVTSDLREGIAYFVPNLADEKEYLAFYQDIYGNILSIKKIHVENDGDYSTVSFKRIDDSEFISAKGNMIQNTIEFLSYDKSVFGQAVTRISPSKGCSFCLDLCSIPWSLGFGYAHPLASVGVTVAFAVLSLCIC